MGNEPNLNVLFKECPPGGGNLGNFLWLLNSLKLRVQSMRINPSMCYLTQKLISQPNFAHYEKIASKDWHHPILLGAMSAERS